MNLRNRRPLVTATASSLAATAVFGLAACAPSSPLTGTSGTTGGSSISASGPVRAGTRSGGAHRPPQVLDDRPNVLMITADDAAPGDLPYMPRTERLIARRGVTFTDALSPDPICVPARASMLTGQYAHNHQALTIGGQAGGVDAFNDKRTLPIWLQNAGYDTLFIGKYLNGYGHGTGDPTDIPPGWTQWRPTWGGSTYNFTHPTLDINGRLHKYHEYNSRLFQQQTQELLRQPRRTRHPWFMWVNYVAPHRGGPIQPDDPQRLYPDDPSVWIPTTHPAGQDQGRFADVELPHNPSMFRSVAGEPSDGAAMSRTKRQMVRVGYEQRLEALQSVDRAVSRTVATLRKTHQLANTVLIFNSDNGFLTGQHNHYGKLVHFNDSERVPMVMSGPGIPKDIKVRTAVADSDIPTTIAAIAHARPTRRQDGVNMLPWLSRSTWDRVVPIEAYPVKGGTTPIYTGIREGPWTYVHWTTKGGFEELYDRSHDRFEMHNLAGDPAYRRQLRHFRRLDRRYRDCAGPTCPKAFVNPSRRPLLYGR